jgi:hypothetical protein
VGSSDDVSTASYGMLFLLLEFSSHAFLWQILMKKFLSLGTECVEFLKAAQASQGKLFVLYLLLVSCVFPWFLIRLSFSYSIL